MKKWPQKCVLMESCLNYSLKIWKNGRKIRFQANYIHFINYIGSKNLAGHKSSLICFHIHIAKKKLETIRYIYKQRQLFYLLSNFRPTNVFFLFSNCYFCWHLHVNVPNTATVNDKKNIYIISLASSRTLL